MLRVKKVTVNLSPEEYELIKSAAEKIGDLLAIFVRRAALRAAKQEVEQ